MKKIIAVLFAAIIGLTTFHSNISASTTPEFSSTYSELNSEFIFSFDNLDLLSKINDIVKPKQMYTYKEMMLDIKLLASKYPDLIETEIIGHSVEGRPIPAIKLGNGQKEIFINGAHHAREHMTTNLLMEMLEEYADAYKEKKSIKGFNVKRILDQVSIWFVPMVNPDGVTLVQLGPESVKTPLYVFMLNDGNSDFSSWKANVRGVDLNRQYPAGWKYIDEGVYSPAPSNYKGRAPLSEPEAKAVYDFTMEHDFKIAVAYHSAGRMIFWYYNQEEHFVRDLNIATRLSILTDYRLVTPKVTKTEYSAGGYTDWFIKEMKRPGLTPEIAPYTEGQPVPIEDFKSIWKRNHAVGLMLAKEALRLN